MGRIETSRIIDASVERVFDTVAHVEEFRKAVPDIVGIEFVSETKRGVGTRFKETRRMGRRQATVELEVSEYSANDHVRITSDAGGTLWDTTFRVQPMGDGRTRLTMTMNDKAHRLLAKVFVPMIRPMVRRAVERDMDAVKAFCERAPAQQAH